MNAFACRARSHDAGDDLPIRTAKELNEWLRCRRERIATAVLAGFAARRGVSLEPAPYTVECAIRWAEALIAELDK